MDYPPNNFLAPFWVNLDVGLVNEGKLFTQVQGSTPNRTFIAEWFNVTPMGGITQTLTK
jgi:hypothetical protein